MKEGGVKKNPKKQPTTKTQTKPPVLIKPSVDSNPEKGEKAPDLMREGEDEGEEQNSPRCFLSHPTGISTSSLWEQKTIRCCAKQGFDLIPAPSLFSKQAKAGGSGVLALGPRGWDGPTTAGMQRGF